MKVTYIHHSAFCVEIAEKVLVFDYYDGKSIPSCQYNGTMPEYPENTKIYVFSSHSHRDHFDKKVLKWAERYPNIHYIFAKEIKRKLGNSALHRMFPEQDSGQFKKKISYVKPRETLVLEDITVETLVSTDQGVAFLVTCEERCIYHAGDLNWWHWEGEPEENNRYQAQTYQEQITYLAGKKLDIAFVIIDPRQEKERYLGIDFFINHVDALHIIPMHMWKQYHLIQEYKNLPKHHEMKSRIVEVRHENQEITFQ